MTISIRMATVVLALLTLWIPVSPSLCRAWCSQPAEELPPCHAQAEDSAAPGPSYPSDAGDCCHELESERLHGVMAPDPGALEIVLIPNFVRPLILGTTPLSRNDAKPPDRLASPFEKQNAPLLS